VRRGRDPKALDDCILLPSFQCACIIRIGSMDTEVPERVNESDEYSDMTKCEAAVIEVAVKRSCY